MTRRVRLAVARRCFHERGIALESHFVLITGCSGGGKSALLAALKGRGHHVIEEPGRRIVKRELETGGRAVPWIDALAFTRCVIATALADRETATTFSGWVFFDRGLIDAASALELLSGESVLNEINALHPYDRCVFLAPPWPEIYVSDAERRHGFAAARAEYERLERQLRELGYDIIILPKMSVAARADFVLNALDRAAYGA
jgi:predicted ATPase